MSCRSSGDRGSSPRWRRKSRIISSLCCWSALCCSRELLSLMSSTRRATKMLPSASVNLMAFVRKFCKTWIVLCESPKIIVKSWRCESLSTVKKILTPRSRAVSASMVNVLYTTSGRLIHSLLSWKNWFSSFARSSMSTMRDSICFTLNRSLFSVPRILRQACSTRPSRLSKCRSWLLRKSTTRLTWRSLLTMRASSLRSCSFSDCTQVSKMACWFCMAFSSCRFFLSSPSALAM
mmetsp:Transcript_399/g.782  ORF Transcript_399/g.782 Transcript_399/m.782 type:complete len:235 (+) Transcript_399:233-937(+)